VRLVIAGHSCSKNGIAPLAYDPAISMFVARRCQLYRDDRDKPGHDKERKALVVMSKGTPRKAKSDDVLLPKYKSRRLAAYAAVARQYCDWFALWRDCRYKLCRSARRCVGDEGTCLKKRWTNVPYEVSRAAELRMFAETPPDADRFVRLARHQGPHSLLLHNPSGRAKTGTRPQAEANRDHDDANHISSHD
jgi:hypothetical protein